MTHDLTELKEYWRVEFLKSEFSWRKILTRIIKCEQENFYFWWRLANEMFLYGSKIQKQKAKRIQRQIIQKYNVEIQLGAKIGKGLHFVHLMAIEITSCVEIGENFECHQMVTIGLSKEPLKIIIGDNVNIGCGTIILGGTIRIGDNVTIGAMSFINKDIPGNCSVYTEKTNKIKI